MSEDATLDEFIKSEDTETDEISTETPQELDLGPRSLGLPDQWGKTEFGSTFSHQRGVNYSSDNYVSEGEGMVFLTLNAIAPGGGLKKDSLKFYDDDIPDEKTTTEGDILMANTDLNQDGEIIGYPVRVPSFKSGVQKCFSHHLLKIEQKQETYDSQFLEYLFSADYIHDRMIAFSCGSTVLNLNTDLLDSLELPVPSIDEQRKIASVLYNVDQAIQKTEEIIEQVRTIKQGVIQDEMDGRGSSSPLEKKRIGPRTVSLPEDWEIVQIGDAIEQDIILKQQDGNHGSDYPRKDEFVDEGIPYLSAEMLSEGEVDFSQAKYLTEERANELRIGFAQDEDVLLAHNATVGPAGLLKTDRDFVIIGTSLTYYRCNSNRLDNKYLTYFFQSGTFQKQLQDVMRQSTRNQVPITRQKNLNIILPPVDEQREISERIDIIIARLRNEIDYHRQLQHLKYGLMQDLLSGTVRTTDTNIEVPDEIAQHG